MILYMRSPVKNELVLGIFDGKKLNKLTANHCKHDDFFKCINSYLKRSSVGWRNLQGVAVVTGSGSFSALRTLSAIANTASFCFKLRLLSASASENDSDSAIASRLVRVIGSLSPAYAQKLSVDKQKPVM
ncbi:MAG: hypothetical protein ACD_76C00053G0007 [uncultured bacterium]|nr:MAG: hypothetical protein ACD_76C00053G0007 [uncultured bacterium]HBD05633.1 hypothetical protein [Candidatus Uhrbacteria bacterium]